MEGERYIDIQVGDLLEVTLFSDEDFLKIKETLTRIGVSAKHDRKLWQSCHILHKRGKYYIVHFKEMFALDGLPTNIDENDISRRNRIAFLLEEWGLLAIVSPESFEENVASVKQIKIIPHREKHEWELCPKYHIGKR